MDQATKDKEAVAKMIGARDAMTLAIDRIRILENKMKEVRTECDRINKGFSGSVYLEVYRDSKYTSIKINDLFKNIDNIITSVI